jgi:hypothetical protein
MDHVSHHTLPIKALLIALLLALLKMLLKHFNSLPTKPTYAKVIYQDHQGERGENPRLGQVRKINATQLPISYTAINCSFENTCKATCSGFAA